MSVDPQLMAAAATVRRSVMSLGRRLRLERPADGRTSLELSTLGHLHHRGPMTPGEIATAERVQPQSLTRTLTSLEADGLISKAGHPRDGRMILLEVTEAGRAALRRDMAARDSWLAQAMAARLTATELELAAAGGRAARTRRGRGRPGRGRTARTRRGRRRAAVPGWLAGGEPLVPGKRGSVGQRRDLVDHDPQPGRVVARRLVAVPEQRLQRPGRARRDARGQAGDDLDAPGPARRPRRTGS